jgi:ubiquinone/menaquinone biosynthesis C-methylase UbiE
MAWSIGLYGSTLLDHPYITGSSVDYFTLAKSWHNGHMPIQRKESRKVPKNTSWESVAGWYDKLLEGEGTYQKELILPNLLRLMGIKRGDVVLDLACGQGFFAREFAARGAVVTGVDASKALIAIARRNTSAGSAMTFRDAPADALPFVKNGSMDKAAIVLALQNMENVAATLRECARVMKPGSELYVVLNHPAFRVPKASGWGWDEKEKVQYRRIDRYLSELKVPIQMHPGDAPKQHTLTFHRPLQYYFKAFNKAGFSVAMMEEWNSHKKSQEGPRSVAEDIARKEIPLFLCLVAVRV